MTPTYDQQTMSEQEYESRVLSGSALNTYEPKEVEWVVPALIPTGYGIIASGSKVGKSWFVLDLALRVSGSLPPVFLGREVEQRPVLYMALEDGITRAKRRTMQLGAETLTDSFHMIDRDSKQIACLNRFMDKHQERKPLVIVDMSTQLEMDLTTRGQAGTYLNDVSIGQFYKDLIHSHASSSVLTVRHIKKGEVTQWTQGVMGTTGVVGTADYVLRLDRASGETKGTLNVTGRDVETTERALTFLDGRWTLNGGSDDEARANATIVRVTSGLGDQSTQIVNDLIRHGTSTPAEVAERLNLDNKTVGNALTRMTERGRVNRVGRGQYFVPDYEDGVQTPGESGESGESLEANTPETDAPLWKPLAPIPGNEPQQSSGESGESEEKGKDVSSLSSLSSPTTQGSEQATTSPQNLDDTREKPTTPELVSPLSPHSSPISTSAEDTQPTATTCKHGRPISELCGPCLASAAAKKGR